MKRWLPLFILCAALTAFFLLGWHHYLSFETLQEHHQTLKNWTEQHYFLAMILFMLTYLVSVAISLPGAAILTLLAGYLFGTLAGSLCVVISATLGAIIIFLAIRTSLGEVLTNKASGMIKKMEPGLKANALSYMFFLRLIPLFPFWAVNIVAGVLKVPLRDYSIATFFGIIPGTVVYVMVGNTLNRVLDAGNRPDMSIIFKPQILIPILLLAILSLVPILYKHWKKRH